VHFHETYIRDLIYCEILATENKTYNLSVHSHFSIGLTKIIEHIQVLFVVSRHG